MKGEIERERKVSGKGGWRNEGRVRERRVSGRSDGWMKGEREREREGEHIAAGSISLCRSCLSDLKWRSWI